MFLLHSVAMESSIHVSVWIHTISSFSLRNFVATFFLLLQSLNLLSSWNSLLALLFIFTLRIIHLSSPPRHLNIFYTYWNSFEWASEFTSYIVISPTIYLSLFPSHILQSQFSLLLLILEWCWSPHSSNCFAHALCGPLVESGLHLSVTILTGWHPWEKVVRRSRIPGRRRREDVLLPAWLSSSDRVALCSRGF